MKVVGIHGILHDYLTAPQIENDWLLALQGGSMSPFEKDLRSGMIEREVVHLES